MCWVPGLDWKTGEVVSECRVGGGREKGKVKCGKEMAEESRMLRAKVMNAGLEEVYISKSEVRKGFGLTHLLAYPPYSLAHPTNLRSVSLV